LSDRIPQVEQNGAIVSSDGRKLGAHRGLFHYTIGQRRGLGLADTRPWFVIGLDPQTRNVIVGKEEELSGDRLCMRHPHWLSGHPPDTGMSCQIKIRYRHQGAAARLKQIDEHRWEILFDTRQRAITPGQFAVIYDHNQVVGCGEIE
jgi:tRNA-specific 2-thiouridylase